MSLLSPSLILVGMLGLAPAPQTQKTCPQWEKALTLHGLPAKHFSSIMWRESRCNPLAVNVNTKSRNDVGLLQINASWSTLTKQTCRTQKRTEVALLSPTCNLRVAGYLYQNGGLRHWKNTNRKEKP